MESLLLTLQRGQTAALLLLALTVTAGLLLTGWIVLAVKLSRVSSRLNALTRGGDGSSLESSLNACMDAVESAGRRMETIEQSVGVLQAQIPGCVRHVHMVRFDAFEDVGGQQSFSVALKDGQDNGVILTGVYGRSDVRVYCKSIQNGRASHALTQEEVRALQGT